MPSLPIPIPLAVNNLVMNIKGVIPGRADIAHENRESIW